MAEPETDIEFIEVVEEILDNKMAGIMLICGAVAGAFLLYLYFEYRKNHPQTLGIGAFQPPVEIPQEPSYRGQ